VPEELPLVEGDQPIPYPENPLVVTDETGDVIFALHHDGTVTMPDPEKAPMAAAIFWREVLAMADDLGIQVVTR
jgi:hypothetical protein